MGRMEKNGLTVNYPKSLEPLATEALTALTAISRTVKSIFGMSFPKTTVVLDESELTYIDGRCGKGSIHLGIPLCKDANENLGDMVLTLVHEAGHVVSSYMVDEIFGEAFAAYFALTTTESVLQMLERNRRLPKKEMLSNVRRRINDYENIKERGTYEAAISFLLEFGNRYGTTAIGEALANMEHPAQSRFLNYLLSHFENADSLLQEYGKGGPIPFRVLDDEKKYGFCNGVLTLALMSHPSPEKAAEAWKQNMIDRIEEIAPDLGLEGWFMAYVNSLLPVVSEQDPVIDVADDKNIVVTVNDCMMKCSIAFQGIPEHKAGKLCKFCLELFTIKRDGVEISITQNKEKCQIRVQKT